MFSQSGILSRHLKNVHKNAEKHSKIRMTNSENTDNFEMTRAFSDTTKGNITPQSDPAKAPVMF